MSFKPTRVLESRFPNGSIWTLLLFTLISFVSLYKGFRFNFPNFIFTYPFISYDGYQWMSDGLHYLDRNIDATHRNPALPLIFSLLRTLGLVDSYMVIIGLLTVGFYASAYFLLRAFFDRPTSRLTVLWFFFVFRIHNFFDYVLSDPWCLTLITLGLGFLVRAAKQPRMLPAAAVAFGLAMNFQFAPAFASPALVWFLLIGIGIKNLREHRWISIASVTLFLLLVLPQFIYKWIAFGSPLYSHVIHFPLIRVHLFGLPFYAVNFFSFLGWPLAAIVLWGFSKSFNNRDPDWQLIHFYGLCMFIFWIVCYLWLDVRFLLYLIPAWLIYAAKGIDALGLLRRLSLKGKTILQKSAIIIGVYFAISMAGIKVIAFESTVLPITPQLNLRFSATPITEWNVSTLTLDKILTEHFDNDDTLMNFNHYSGFYRGFARGPKAQSGEFVRDVLAMAKTLEKETTSSERIGLCGDLWSVFETKMKIHFTIARNIGGCGSANKYWIVRNPSVKELLDANPGFNVTWQGSELSLLKAKL